MASDGPPQDEVGDGPHLLTVEQTPAAVVRGRVPMPELPAFFDRSFTALAGALQAQGITPTGPPYARYLGPIGEVVDLEVGFPTPSPIQATGEVEAGSLPGGRVARAIHRGAFDDLSTSWERLRAWIDEQGLAIDDSLWEVYLVEPTPDMDPDDLRTELNWPVRG